MTPEQSKEEFIELYNKYITREGADKLLEYLKRSDFFSAPASTRYHLCVEGGLCAHSINVFKRFKKHIESEEKISASDETIAICGLLHDLCKINYYATEMKNIKQNGVWVQEPKYMVNEELPYGHGEKSVYIICGFMKLSREEAISINWHMGWSDARAQNGGYSLSAAYNKYPLATLLHVADIEATYIDENSDL